MLNALYVKDFFICFGRIEEANELVKVLEQQNWRVSAFSDPVEMLEAFSTEGCKAFIIDTELGQSASYMKTISIIRNMSPEVPIIVSSSDASLEREREARSLNIFFYYVRPIADDELIQLARDAAKKSAARVHVKRTVS